MLFSLLTPLPTWLFFSSPQSMTATWRRWQCDSQNRDINNSQKEKCELFTKMEIWAQSWKIILQKSFHFSQGVISSSESATNVKWSETTDLQKKRHLDAKLPSYQISKNYQTGILICSLHISTTKWGETADLLLGQNDGWHPARLPFSWFAIGQNGGSTWMTSRQFAISLASSLKVGDRFWQ